MKKFTRTPTPSQDRETEIDKLYEAGKTVQDSFTRAEAAVAYDDILKAERWKNDLYAVQVDRRGTQVHLMVSRLDGEPIRNWKHLQQIKNEFVGPECEGVELFPAESRLIDAANIYHLWVIDDPTFIYPMGYHHPEVPDASSNDNEDKNSVGDVA